MNHNQEPSQQSSLKLPFMQEFDGHQPPVSPEEQAAVTVAFQNLASDLLLNSPDMVKLGGVTSFRSMPYDYLRLQVPGSDGSVWSVTAACADSRLSSRPDVQAAQIAMDLTDANGEPRIGATYSINRQAVVIRTDAPDLLRVDQDPAGGSHDSLDPDQDAVDSEELEVMLGLNDQPISMAEFEGLKQFLTGPDVTVIPTVT